MPDMPEGAQRSPDGYYWWDESAQTWQPVDGHQAATSDGVPDEGGDGAGQQGTERTAMISVEPGVVLDQIYSHDEVVAMVEQGGAALPLHEGEALA
ncbi:MAG: hypothetical protein ABI345_12770 [Jatrophihabitans sp.]